MLWHLEALESPTIQSAGAAQKAETRLDTQRSGPQTAAKDTVRVVQVIRQMLCGTPLELILPCSKAIIGKSVALIVAIKSLDKRYFDSVP